MNQDMQSKIEQAKELLKAFGLPSAQQNERACLTLLALANLKPSDDWSDVTNDLYRTVDLMGFMSEFYLKEYKPNTRETIRRQTLHQFMQHGLVIKNRDDLSRPTNSGNTNYSLNDEVVEILRQAPDGNWEDEANAYAIKAKSLLKAHKKRVAKTQVVVSVPYLSDPLRLSAGAHNQLQADIIQSFLPQFASDDIRVLYIGDTASIDGTGGKFALMDVGLFSELNIPELAKDKLPDIVAFDPKTGWLYLIEAVTSHGPISEKRWQELQTMLESTKLGCVYVTAFPDRATFRKYSADVAWETEVWLANEPEHMIHFNGDRYLGPH
jgi:hypothetical protein